MKNVIYILIIILLSCAHKKEPYDKRYDLGNNNQAIESVAHKVVKDNSISVDSSMRMLDSATYYYTMQMDYINKRNQCEIKYLRTGKDKYRIRGNHYVDSAHHYFLLLHAIANNRNKVE